MISLRNIEKGDLEQIRLWRMDTDITRYMNTDPVITPEGQLRWFEKICRDTDVRYWMILVEGEPAGVINLTDLQAADGEIGWAYYVGEKRLRSMKLALALEMNMYDEALIRRKKAAVISDVFTLNQGVIALHKLCGCEILCEKKRAVEKNGISYDVTYMRMGRERWEQLRDSKKYEKFGFPEED